MRRSHKEIYSMIFNLTLMRDTDSTHTLADGLGWNRKLAGRIHNLTTSKVENYW